MINETPSQIREGDFYRFIRPRHSCIIRRVYRGQSLADFPVQHQPSAVRCGMQNRIAIARTEIPAAAAMSLTEGLSSHSDEIAIH